ncbi:hypothetical protein B0H14DRAFT_3860915 [Mycena olivaceomarginata]|nr:hypothetical protein B0H14DRAFT_3860915 [Mycena olivaceomarginata]
MPQPASTHTRMSSIPSVRVGSVRRHKGRGDSGARGRMGKGQDECGAATVGEEECAVEARGRVRQDERGAGDGKGEARASGRCRTTSGVEMRTRTRRQQNAEGGTTQLRCDDTGYSTARGAGDPRSVVIYRPSSVTLLLASHSAPRPATGIEIGIHRTGVRTQARRKGREQRVLPSLPLLTFAIGSRSPQPRRPLACATLPSLPSAPLIHPDHDVDHMDSESTTSPTDSADVPAFDSVGWARADCPSWAGDAAGVRVRCLSNSPGSILPLRFPVSTSLFEPLTRSLLVTCDGEEDRIGGAPRALVPVHPRVSHRVPVHPIRNARRSIPPVSEPPQDHASLGLHMHPSLGLVQTLPSRRGSRAPRDWALREVREGRRVPPPPPVMAHAWIRIRITTTGTTVHKKESPPLPRTTPKAKRSVTAFIATGDEHISPLTVSSVVESRTTSPWLTNGIKRKSPLALNGVPAPANSRNEASHTNTSLLL